MLAEDSNFCMYVTRHDGYFLTACRGEVTLARVLRGWSKLAQRCFEERVNRVICQPHAPGPAEFLDVYQFGISFREIAWPPGTRIAIVCGTEDLAKYRLAETLERNLQGPESRIFATLEEARAWVLRPA